VKLFLQEAVPEQNPIPGAIIAIQTFGHLLNDSTRIRQFASQRCIKDL